MALADRLIFDATATEGLVDWCRRQLITSETVLDAHRAIARRLGGIVSEDRASIGFWTPELLDHRVPDGDIFLEVLAPRETLDLTRSLQSVRFERVLLPVQRYEAHTFCVVEGMRAGRRDAGGDFYALVWRDVQGE